MKKAVAILQLYFGYQAVDLPNTITFSNQPRIAVLTSRWTVSSGELFATALKGRAATRFFGEATGGATTNTCFERIAGRGHPVYIHRYLL